jgi:hypothetical protein
MANKKEEQTSKVIIWVNIDFPSVKRRIQRINNRIERVLSKYESQLADDLSSKARSEEDDF